MEDKKLLNIIGVIALLSILVYLYKLISEKTDTKLYSEDALNALENDDKYNQIEEIRKSQPN